MILIKPSYSNYDNVFFDYKINLIDGKTLELSKYSDHAVLLVNTASYCGFTKQYNDLQKLWEIYKEKKFLVVAIPSNSFNQEKNNNTDIKDFCETNFNISFPMTSKYNVKGNDAHPVYVWAKKTYGNSTVPKWNFHKILINKDGKVQDTFASFTNPMSNKIRNQIERIIK